MHSGDLVVGRFEIRELTGYGGMGTVYKSLDNTTGEMIALKVLSTATAVDEARFRRETELLAELSHPAIVKYIAHGVIPTGAPFLAMEWLDGEDLGVRLTRSELSITETLVIARRVAAALAVAHREGVIHRDVKPSNLVLLDGQPSQVKVVDFGLARMALPSRPMTNTGAVIGTLGYMAPEQARGEREIDAHTDVFALGCVLYECLTGKGAFSGADVVAVLVKILSGKSPRVSSERPDVPEAIDDLVAHMMAKEPKDRLADGAAVLEAIEGLGQMSSLSTRLDSPSPKAISRGEQRMLSIILVSEGGDDDLFSKETLTPEQIDVSLEPIRRVARPLGGEVAPLANGTVMVLLKGRNTATDQASKAATCALSIYDTIPGSRLALSTGPAEVTGQWPEGVVIDRAAQLLKLAKETATGGVLIDEITSGLLDMRFDLETGELTHLLHGERALMVGRQLLGRPTPCVGRNKELIFLESYFYECINESTAGAVLVTGVPGIGKSRLGAELIARLRKEEAATVLTARGNSVSAGSALSIASQLVHYAARLRHGGGQEQHRKLRSYLDRYFEGAELTRLAEFLGELVKFPSDETPSPQLRAAQNDARIMSEQLRRAFEDWLGTVCSSGPLLLLIEDLHWGDLPSVNLIDGAMRLHAEAPLLVLAIARPEVTKTFPRLWENVDVHGLQLGVLKRRASEQLVRAVLGDDIAEETVARIVSQAGGNAFHLEELIRHVADGGGADFPETVLAIAQSRLDALDPEVRRVLRAAAVFGDVLWEDALRKLLGNAMVTADLTEWVNLLLDREILEHSREGRFPGQREIVFRHDLLREAAYSMLTMGDRKLGHRLAAEWLENAGEPDSLIIADHFVKGDKKLKAIPFFIRAAKTALDAGNLDAAIDIAERGLDCDAEGDERGRLRLVQMFGHAFRNEFTSMSGAAQDALTLIIPGTTPWFQALSGMAGAGSWGGDPMALMQALQALSTFRGELKDIGPVGYAGNIICDSLCHIGQREQAHRLYQRLEETVAASADPDPVFLGWVQLTRAIRSNMGQGPLGEALPNAESAMDQFEEVHDGVARCICTTVLGWTQYELGLIDQAEATCHKAVELAVSLKIPLAEGLASLYLDIVRILQGRTEEAIESLMSLVDGTNPLLAAYGRSELALAYRMTGDLDSAVREAILAVETSSIFPIANAHALSELAAAKFDKGEPEEALEAASKALALCEKTGIDQFVESFLRLTHIKALNALDRKDEAKAAVTVAKEHLLKQSDSLHLSELRSSYLNDMPQNAELLKLARELIKS